MMFNIKIVVFAILNAVLTVNSAKILIVFNHFGKSHYFQGKALGHGLARAGHEVTMVSPFQDRQYVKMYNEIVLDGIMDNLGVILFSFGSFVNPSQLSPRVKQAFVKALGKLKQKVLWKSDEDSFLGKPNNIKLSKWLPQEDILAHPNCKLFITHAGFLSTIETIYHGVPVLTFPLTGDQDLNAFRAVEIDMGHTAVLRDITEEKLDYFLDQLLHNDNYRQNAKKRSEYT
ncbi:UDP-glycosyltransferase UGT5-like [Diabrotica virgifera virgifera]|uniref:UDP-glucuronosyltransferase n=1 Tax=Diabrotica virgifera virgifera TaxID=50390 RepID=A0ABM5K0E3_DIAVI|nr:UDP-glycosyltransferase UGT5-like [Diabrotica virgifera virgifera]